MSNMVLHLPGDAALVVCGAPGAGKSTWIERTVSPTVTRLSCEQIAADHDCSLSHALDLMLVYVQAAVRDGQPVTCEITGCLESFNDALIKLIIAADRTAHVIGIDVDAHTRRAGQAARGRSLSESRNKMYDYEWARVIEDPRDAFTHATSVTMLDRPAADRVGHVLFG